MLAVTGFGLTGAFFFSLRPPASLHVDHRCLFGVVKNWCRSKSFLKVIVMLQYFGSHISCQKKKKSLKLQVDFWHLHNRHLKMFYKVSVCVSNPIEFTVPQKYDGNDNFRLPLISFLFFQMYDGCDFTITSVLLLEGNFQNKAGKRNLLFCCFWPEWWWNEN